MKKIAIFLTLLTFNQVGWAGPKMDTTYVTADNCWKIADYAYKSELIGDSSVREINPNDREVNFAVKLQGFAIKILHGNSLIAISNLHSKISFSATFNSSDGHAALSPQSQQAKRLKSRELQKTADTYFKEILEAIATIETARSERNKKAGNYLTFDNYRAIDRYLHDHNESPAKNYCKVHMANLLCEYGEGSLTITDTTSGKKYCADESMMENTNGNFKDNPRDSVNEYFMRVVRVINKMEK